MSDSKSKIAKGVSSQTLITVLAGIIEVAYFSSMSRLLTKEEFGLYAVATSITVIFDSLANAGLGTSVVQRKDPSKAYIDTAFTLSLILGTFFTILLFSFSGILSNLLVKSDLLSTPLKIMSITLLLNCVISIARALFLRNLNFLKLGFITIGVTFVSYSLSVYLAYIGFGIYAVIYGNLLMLVLSTITLYSYAHFKPHISIVKEEVKGMVSYGGWLTATVMVRCFSEQMTNLVMPRITNVTLLGTYNRPARLIDIITGKITNIFDTVLFPILSNIQDSFEKMRAAFLRIFELLMIFTTVLTFFLVLSSEFLVQLFLGEQWLDLVSLLQIISIVAIFSVFCQICDCFFRSLAFMKTYFTIRCITLVITFVLIVIGCKYGLYAVALAYILSKGIDFMIKVSYLCKHFKVKFFNIFWLFIKRLIIPTVFFYPLFFISPYVPMSGIISAGVYALTMIALAVLFPKLFGMVYYQQIYLSYIQPVLNIRRIK